MPSDLTIIAPEQGRKLTNTDSDDAFIQLWLQRYDGHTAKMYRRIGEAYVEALGKPLRESNYNDCTNALDVITSDCKRSSRATYTAAVKSMLRFAFEVQYMPLNVSPLLRPPKVAKSVDMLAEKIVTVEQMTALIRGAVSERDRMLIIVGYYGGLRVSEIVGLTWGALRPLDDGRTQIVNLTGKGGKVRQVYLPASVTNQLQAYRCGAPSSAPLFVSRHNRALSTRQAMRIIKKAAAAAGLTDEISPHWLRHAHISHSLDAGSPPHVVQQSVGHASLATTTAYAHATKGASSSDYLKDIT